MPESSRERELRLESERLFDSFAPRAEIDAAAKAYEEEYAKRRVNWEGFQPFQAVRTDDGRVGVITFLAKDCCGLVEVDLEQRQLLGHIFDACTPDRLQPLVVDAALAAELKVLVVKVHRKTGSVHRAEDLLAEYLPSWSRLRVG